MKVQKSKMERIKKFIETCPLLNNRGNKCGLFRR